MISRRQLTPAEAEHAMRHGEFEEALLSSCPNLAVVLTQDWCGQWAAMNHYLQDMTERPRAGDPDICVLELQYNRVPYFRQFLEHKERVWGNAQVPYVRYYRGGRLVAQSNYVSMEEFVSFFRD